MNFCNKCLRFLTLWESQDAICSHCLLIIKHLSFEDYLKYYWDDDSGGWSKHNE